MSGLAGGAPRIDFLTRLRCDARLYALPLPPEQRPKGKPGPQPKWGQRLDPPRRGGMWKAKWQVGTAFVYGRQRTIRWKEIICLWQVLGWDVPVKVIVAAVEGSKERFTLVTSQGHRIKIGGLGRMANSAFGGKLNLCGTSSNLLTRFVVDLVVYNKYNVYVR